MQLKDKVEKLMRVLNNLQGSTDRNQELIQKLTERITLLEDQNICTAKGHKMVFEKVKINESWPYLISIADTYIFKCSDCHLEILKTKVELTTIEKDALKKLKLL